MLNDDQYKDIIIKKIAPTHILINDILSLRKQQLYPVLDEDILNDLDVLWDDLTYCTSSDDLIEWMLSFREYLWGNKNEWDEAKQWFSIDDEEYYIRDKQAFFIFVCKLGNPNLRISEDQSDGDHISIY